MARLSLHDLNVRARQRAKARYLSAKSGLSVIFKVWHYSKPHRKYMYLTLLFNFLQNVTELLIPIFMGFAINAAVGPGNVNFSAILSNLGIMLGLVVVTSLFNWVSSLTVNAFTYRTSYRFRELFFRKINTVPLNYIDTNSHGDLLSRMVNDIDAVCDGFLQSVASLISGVFVIIGTIVAMYILNAKMATIILVLTPMSVFISLYIIKKSKKFFKMEVENQGELSGYLEEYIGGQRVVKAFSHEEESIDSFEKINEKYYKTAEKSQFYGNLANPFTRFINGIVYGIVGFVGALLVLSGEPLFTIGTISSFLSYANSFGKPFNEISSEISDIQTAFAAVARVFQVLEEPNEVSDAELPDLITCSGDIEIKNVNFSYIPKVRLIENFNVSIKAGQKVAIVGPTGCGKTTMINLLMRFYDVNSGSIEVSGKDINTITRSSLRSKYGMVLQDTWLFEDSVRNNISYGNPNAPLEEIIEAAKLAGVHDFIMKMENGYDTMIIEGGANLSQGEKQLICIARIMLLKPPMLILDEATSNIDTRTELNIQRAFDEIMKGRTSFVIAHRLSTITNSDIILVMNKGNVIEQGTHHQLLEKKGFYYNLFNSQYSHNLED